MVISKNSHKCMLIIITNIIAYAWWSFFFTIIVIFTRWRLFVYSRVTVLKLKSTAVLNI